MINFIVLGLWDLIKGYVYGIWLRALRGLKHHKHSRLVETVAYNEFQNPHVVILDCIYPEIGLGIYQGEVVIIREGVTWSEYRHRWVIYKLEDHHRKHLKAEELLQIACTLVHKILLDQHYEFCLMDWQKPDRPEVKIDRYESQCGEHRLCSPVVCGCTDIYPKADVVYEIVRKCSRLRYYLN